MRKFLRNNYFYIFLLVPLFFICVINIRPDNDIWFLLNNGRYIFQHGIPKVDPFTIHEGLDYIMQQWLTSAIFWKVYDFFGPKGILTMVMLLAILLIYLYYRLCFTISNNKKLSVLITAIIMVLCYKKIVSRPQMFTYIALILEMIFLEMYIKKDNWKYLIPLVIISLLEINLHSTMWCFLFLVLIPYILNGIKIKNITIDKVRIMPLIIVGILMILVGLINPYGHKSLLIIFNSYGSSNINSHVTEMQPLTIDKFDGKSLILSLLIYFGLVNLKKKERIDIRHICIFVGFTLLAFLHNKGFPYYAMALGVVLASHFRKIDIDRLEKKVFKKFIKVWKPIVYALSFFVFISAIYTVYLEYSYYKWGTFTSYPAVFDVIEENYDLEDVRMYTTFDDGGYFEYKEIKVYVDPRAEVFLKKFNHKEDILDEYYYLNYDSNYDIEDFLNKYHFTHLFVPVKSYLYKYLINDDNYEIVYKEYLDVEKTKLDKCLFVYKGE